MKSIDKEIFEVEQRLHMREASLKRNARETRQRTVKALMSPVSIVGAVALGFLVAGGVGAAQGEGATRPWYRRRPRSSRRASPSAACS